MHPGRSAGLQRTSGTAARRPRELGWLGWNRSKDTRDRFAIPAAIPASASSRPADRDGKIPGGPCAPDVGEELRVVQLPTSALWRRARSSTGSAGFVKPNGTSALPRPYRAKTKGKVERPFRYIREDFFLARSFGNLADLNEQLRRWLDAVANPRVHATTRRVVNEAFAEEKLHLRPLPLAPFRAVLRLERRISSEGMVSVGGNFYSVPDATRRRTVEVHTLAEEIRIFEDGTLIIAHPVLEGRHQRRIAPGHRTAGAEARRRTAKGVPVPGRSGDLITPRPLEFYDAVGRRLARESRA